MAGTTAMTLLWAAAEVDLKLGPGARWAGTGLGAIVFLLGATLALRGARSAAQIGLNLPWRRPGGLLMAVCGLLMAAGVWIDPKQRPQLFVALWAGVSLAAAGFLLFAFFDLFSVRWQSLLARLRLLEENRRETEEELRRRARGDRNGRHNPNGKHH